MPLIYSQYDLGQCLKCKYAEFPTESDFAHVRLAPNSKHEVNFICNSPTFGRGKAPVATYKFYRNSFGCDDFEKR